MADARPTVKSIGEAALRAWVDALIGKRTVYGVQAPAEIVRLTACTHNQLYIAVTVQIPQGRR